MQIMSTELAEWRTLALSDLHFSAVACNTVGLLHKKPGTKKSYVLAKSLLPIEINLFYHIPFTPMEGSARNRSFCNVKRGNTFPPQVPPFCALQSTDGCALSHLVTGVTCSWTSPAMHFLILCTPTVFASWCRTNWNNIFNTHVMDQCH